MWCNALLTCTVGVCPSFRWLVFSDPGFQGMLAVLETGVYPFPEAWGFPSPFIGSLRPLKIVRIFCAAEVNLILVATLVTSMAMFREQSHFGPNWNVGWIALKCCIHVYGSQRINSNNFGYRMTFPPVPPWGWLFFFSEISSSIYPLLPWDYSRYRHSWSLEDKFKWL